MIERQDSGVAGVQELHNGWRLSTFDVVASFCGFSMEAAFLFLRYSAVLL
jgi:hypothetical protein